MIEITKSVEWDMGHRVPNHENLCKNPHGHRYRLEATIKGDLNGEKGSPQEGMILDFSDFKNLIMQKIHDPLDHGFMVYEKDTLLLGMFASSENNFKLVKVPFIPTAENIVSWCYQLLAKHLPKNIEISRLRLYETPNSFADFIP